MATKRVKSKRKINLFDWQNCRSAIPFLLSGNCDPGPYQIFESQEESDSIYRKWREAYKHKELTWQKEGLSTAQDDERWQIFMRTEEIN
jgi:hypothetical protein